MLQCSLSFKDVPNPFSFSYRLLMVLPEVWQNHLQTSRWFVEEVMDSIWDCCMFLRMFLSPSNAATYQTWDGIHRYPQCHPKAPHALTHSRLNQILCNRIVLDVQWHIGSHKFGRSGNRANHHVHSLSLPIPDLKIW
jgi:hypothetical protein